jgi:O-antigen/teichoic acid export membrane protein
VSLSKSAATAEVPPSPAQSEGGSGEAGVPDARAFGRLAHGVSTLTIAEAFRVAVSAVLAVYLARRLGTVAFGLWTFGLAVTGYPLALVEAGLTWIGTRDVAAQPSIARPLVRRIVALRLALALVSGAAVLVTAVSLTGPGPGRLVIVFAGCSLVTTALTIDWVFYGLERPSIVAIANVTRVVVFAVAAVLLIRQPALVWGVPLLQAAGEAVAAALLWTAFLRVGPRPDPDGPRVATVDLIRQSAPLTLSQFMRALTMWSAVTMIGLRGTASDVGQFGAAQRLALLAGGFTTLYFYGYLPLAARAARQGPAAVAELVTRSVRLTALATLPFAVAATLLADPVVRLVFGASYSAAAPVLRILVWTIPISVFAGHFRHTLIAERQTRLDLAAVTTGAVTTVALNLLLVGQLGLTGGALAMVAGEVAMTIGAMGLVAARVKPIVPAAPLLRAALPALIVGAVLLMVRAAGLVPALAAGGLAYVVALVACGEVTPAALAAFARGWRGPRNVH